MVRLSYLEILDCLNSAPGPVTIDEILVTLEGSPCVGKCSVRSRVNRHLRQLERDGHARRIGYRFDGGRRVFIWEAVA